MIICDVRLSPFAFNGFRFEMRLSAMVWIRVFLFGLSLLAINLSKLLIPFIGFFSLSVNWRIFTFETAPLSM
jgi:hypothetical protein